MQVSNLRKSSWECVHFFSNDPSDLIKTELKDSNFQVFVINNESIHNDQDLLEAISSAMKLPEYFGNNWDALDESLSDFEEIHHAKGFILLIKNSKILWEKAAFSMGKLIRSWLFAAEEWSKDHIPFHLIFAEME
jgi:hypothetical protein